MGFQRVLSSICGYCLSILNILKAFSCIICSWEKIYTARAFLTHLLNRFIQSLICISIINGIGQYLLINSLVESLNVWAHSTVQLIVSNIHCLLQSVSLNYFHIREEINFWSIFRSKFCAHTYILKGFKILDLIIAVIDHIVLLWEIVMEWIFSWMGFFTFLVNYWNIV